MDALYSKEEECVEDTRKRYIGIRSWKRITTGSMDATRTEIEQAERITSNYYVPSIASRATLERAEAVRVARYIRRVKNPTG